MNTYDPLGHHEPKQRNAAHVALCYGKHLRGARKRWGTFRSLIHCRELVADYVLSRRVWAGPRP